MSSNPYINYYANQAGTGIGGFQGAKFQRGQGFFGNVFRNAILPLMKYFGKKALNTGLNVANDAIEGENVLNSLKTRSKRTVREIASDVGDRAMKFAQTGKGRKRKRKSRKNINIGNSKVHVVNRRKRRRKIKRKTNKKSKAVSSIFI